MRVLVCGGRDNRNEEGVFAVLDRIHAERPITAIIEGGQRTYEDRLLVGGTDLWACRWTYRVGIAGYRFDANWYPNGRLGGIDKSAGPKRNQRMIDEGKPDLVIAFPGGRGTADMVQRAEKAGIEVRKIPSQEREDG